MMRKLTGGLIGCALLLTACAGADLPRPSDDLVPAPESPTPGGPSTPAVVETSGAGTLPAVPGHTWKLIKRDDFDGTELDDADWNVYDDPATNDVSRWSPDNVTVADGELRITGRGKDPSGAGNEAGGLCWCRTGGNRTYGMWRVRARLEPSLGYGQAFLLWPTSERWPQDGELDFAEIPKTWKDEVYGTIHWGDPHESDGASLRADLAQWRTYTVVWRPGLVRFYLDDTMFYDSSAARRDVEVPDKPMHLALQIEPGPLGRWVPSPGPDTPDENITHIDWVELYQ
jgi:hypothetical protein